MRGTCFSPLPVSPHLCIKMKRAMSLRIPRRMFNHSAQVLRKYHMPTLSEIDPVDLEKYRQEGAPGGHLSPEVKEELDSKDFNALNVTSRPADGGFPDPRNEGLIKSFLWGSPSAQREAAEIEQSFSSQLQLGQKIHEVIIHAVVPGKAPDYVDLLCRTAEEAEPKSPGMFTTNPTSRLVGSWRTVTGGDVDTYVHIWEYEGFAGLHHAQKVRHQSQVYLDYLEKLRPMLRSRESQIVQEFSFWGGTAKPRALGGIFELRSYTLKAGTMAEWELHWRKGIEYRRRVMEPVGAWFSSIGDLNRVYHLWQFTDLQQRKMSRQRSWEMPGWAETTHETVKLIDRMHSSILVPLPFSPLK